jgi:hypothetical protein
LIVLVPAALLLWAIYLTHSRGALIALAVLALIMARKSMGTAASVVLITMLVLGVLAHDFTGGRAISAAEGAERLAAWANGLEMFKRAPLFGIGFGRFTEFNDITAHNSFVLCLAELGLVGSTIWVALLVTTTTSLNTIIRQQEEGPDGANLRGESEAKAGGSPFCWGLSLPSTNRPLLPQPQQLWMSKQESNLHSHSLVPTHWIMAMRLALIGFITTGLFLSRSYKVPMYLALGLATATIALQRSATKSCIHSRWVFLTLAVEAAAILCIYGMVSL